MSEERSASAKNAASLGYVGSRAYIVDMLVSGFAGDLHTRDEVESWLDALVPPKPPQRRIERDYTGVNEQIVVKNLSVLVHETDEGVVVDIYPLGEEGVDDPIATSYAFFTEGHKEEHIGS